MNVIITLITVAGVVGLIVSIICFIKLDDRIKAIIVFLITSIISEILFIVALVLSTVVTVAFSMGVSILGVPLAFLLVCSAISHLSEYKDIKTKKLSEQQQRLKEIKYNIIMLKKKQQKILDSYDEQTRVATGDETINNFILSQSDERFSENKTFINNIN